MNKPEPLQDDIISFHQFAGDGDKRNDLLMDRDGIYKTVSVTSLELNDTMSCIQYLDLIDRKRYKSKMGFTSLQKVA